MGVRPGPALIEGSGVFLPASVCAALRRPLVEARQRLWRTGVVLDPAVGKAIDLIVEAASRHLAERSASGMPERPKRGVGAAFLSVRETADLLGVGDRAVRARAGRGSLPGRLTGGRWVFDRRDVLEVMARGHQRA